MSDDRQANVPATVTVVFPRADSGVYLDASYVVDASLIGLGLAEYLDASGNPVDGHTGTRLFHSAAVAYFVGDVNPVNTIQLGELTDRIATDFYLWRLSALEMRYESVVPWISDGMHDVEYRHDDCIQTAVMRSAWEPEFGQFKQAGHFGSIDTPMPDIAAVIQIYSSVPTNGKFDAQAEYRDNAGKVWIQSFPIWAIDLAASETLIPGTEYTAVFAGNEAGGPFIVSIIADNLNNTLSDTDSWIPVVGPITPPAYDSTESYVVGNLISYSGGIYVCIADHINQSPTDTAFWVYLGSTITDSGRYDTETEFALGEYVQAVRPLYAFRSGGGSGEDSTSTGDVLIKAVWTVSATVLTVEWSEFVSSVVRNSATSVTINFALTFQDKYHFTGSAICASAVTAKELSSTPSSITLGFNADDPSPVRFWATGVVGTNPGDVPCPCTPGGLFIREYGGITSAWSLDFQEGMLYQANTSVGIWILVPPCVTRMYVECWGAGGSFGIGHHVSFAGNEGGGGGGGGGAYAAGWVNVTPGEVRTDISVGRLNLVNGNSTTSTTSALGIIASGGRAGLPDYLALGSVMTGGAGGQAADSVGDVVSSGGNGGNGTIAASGIQGGGGGGGGAGPDGAGSNGANGSTSAGGTGGAGGTSEDIYVIPAFNPLPTNGNGSDGTFGFGPEFTRPSPIPPHSPGGGWGGTSMEGGSGNDNGGLIRISWDCSDDHATIITATLGGILFGGSIVANYTSGLSTPTVTVNTDNMPANQATLVITGTNFAPIPGDNVLTFNHGATGTVTSVTGSTSLTVTFDDPPNALGSLTAVLTTPGGNSGAAVQVASVTMVKETHTTNITWTVPITGTIGVTCVSAGGFGDQGGGGGGGATSGSISVTKDDTYSLYIPATASDGPCRFGAELEIECGQDCTGLGGTAGGPGAVLGLNKCGGNGADVGVSGGGGGGCGNGDMQGADASGTNGGSGVGPITTFNSFAFTGQTGGNGSATDGSAPTGGTSPGYGGGGGGGLTSGSPGGPGVIFIHWPL